MYRIGICDDEISTSAKIEEYLLAYEKISLEVELWNDGEAMLRDLDSKCEIDVLFLDIEMEGLNGIEVGKQIRESGNYQMDIVYISSKESYAMALFQNQPVGFLIKPIEAISLYDILDKCYTKKKRNHSLFQYKKAKTVYTRNCKDIMYFSCLGKQVEVCFANGEKDSFYGKIAILGKELPQNFMVVHKSYLINRDFISQYTYEEVRMAGHIPIPISKAHRSDVRAMILRDREGGRL